LVRKEVGIMRRAVLAVLAISLVAVLGCQQQKPPEKPKVTIPKGSVLVKRDLLDVFVDQAEIRMQDAQAALKKRDTAGAARDIRLTIAYMKLQATVATKNHKKGILAAASDLDRIATSLENGEAVSSGVVSAAFGRANYVLARHHHQKAVAATKAGAGQKLKRQLLAAAGAVEAAVKWTGGKPTTEDKASVAAVKSLADKIGQGGEWTKEEANAVLSGLKGQIDKLKAVVEPEPPAASAPTGGGS
jgi:hypothetical protein